MTATAIKHLMQCPICCQMADFESTAPTDRWICRHCMTMGSRFIHTSGMLLEMWQAPGFGMMTYNVAFKPHDLRKEKVRAEIRVEHMKTCGECALKPPIEFAAIEWEKTHQLEKKVLDEHTA